MRVPHGRCFGLLEALSVTTGRMCLRQKDAPKAEEPAIGDAAGQPAGAAQANGEETVPSEVEIQEVDGGEAMETA